MREANLLLTLQLRWLAAGCAGRGKAAAAVKAKAPVRKRVAPKAKGGVKKGGGKPRAKPKAKPKPAKKK